MTEDNTNIPPIVEDQTATQQDVPQVEVKIEDNTGSASQTTPSASEPEFTSPESSDEEGFTSPKLPSEGGPISPETPVSGEPAPMPAHAGATAGQPAVIPEPAESIISRLLTKARQAIKQRKEKKKQKILSALAEKGQLTNKEIRKILRCSDATARRYLNDLEKEGKIQQVGSDGRNVHYKPLN